MLRFDEFRWHVCQPAAVALALLYGSAGSPGWASNPEVPKPCTSQSAGHTDISQSVSESIGERIAESEDRHSAEPPRADPTERNRAAKQGVSTGFCLTYFAQNLVSDQKATWTSPFHLHAKDKNWL